MLFAKCIPISANTLKASPLVTMIPICEGVIKRVWVRWRWGSGGLCGCRILYGSFQVWPLSMTQWFVSNVQDMAFDENMSIADVPHEFRIESYNDDDTFPHTLMVAFSILREGFPMQPEDIMTMVSW